MVEEHESASHAVEDHRVAEFEGMLMLSVVFMRIYRGSKFI